MKPEDATAAYKQTLDDWDETLSTMESWGTDYEENACDYETMVREMVALTPRLYEQYSVATKQRRVSDRWKQNVDGGRARRCLEAVDWEYDKLERRQENLIRSLREDLNEGRGTSTISPSVDSYLERAKQLVSEDPVRSAAAGIGAATLFAGTFHYLDRNA